MLATKEDIIITGNGMVIAKLSAVEGAVPEASRLKARCRKTRRNTGFTAAGRPHYAEFLN